MIISNFAKIFSSCVWLKTIGAPASQKKVMDKACRRWHCSAFDVESLENHAKSIYFVLSGAWIYLKNRVFLGQPLLVGIVAIYVALVVGCVYCSCSTR